jgi:eukaryotic-like serine/threonine-protein kinase
MALALDTKGLPMSAHLTCRLGHHWTLDLDSPGPARVYSLLCPHCRDGAVGLKWCVPGPSTPKAITLQPPTNGVLPAEAVTLPPVRDQAEEPELLPEEPVLDALDPDRPAVPGYEILGVLGRGGMGVVYKARQKGLNRMVALKMILAGGHAGPADLARFRTEAEAVACLQHPGIVQIHEIGDSGGLPFFSLEFVEGGSLADRIKGTPLPPREAARVIETLARAMHHAHERDVLHRDLKPANVLLTTEQEPKITDFGLAKRLEQNAGQTQSGAIMGTPSYMAPEQAEGKNRRIGPAADVYGLGAVLYECLTGRPPFRAATQVDTILQVLCEEPVPPRRLVSRVPRDLETICLKCLRKVPAERHVSAWALAEDLRRFLEGEPIKARRLGLLAKTGRAIKKRPEYALLAFALFFGTLVTAGSPGWLRNLGNKSPTPNFGSPNRLTPPTNQVHRPGNAVNPTPK